MTVELHSIRAAYDIASEAYASKFVHELDHKPLDRELLQQLVPAFAEMHRVLGDGGVLLLSFHVGSEVIHAENFLDTNAVLDFRFFEPPQIEAALSSVGFDRIDVLIRDPYDSEHPSRRCCIFAHKVCWSLGPTGLAGIRRCVCLKLTQFGHQRLRQQVGTRAENLPQLDERRGQLRTHELNLLLLRQSVELDSIHTHEP